MSRTRQLVELIADVRDVADIESADQRHTDDSIARKLNQSIQAFRLMISQWSDYYLTTSASATLTAGDATIAMPDDLIQLYGVDLQVQGKWRELVHYTLPERNKCELTNYNTGAPTYFREHGALISIMPSADAAYTYRLIYLPVSNDLVSDGDSFDGIAGWEDWPVYDTAIRCCTRDASVNDNFELLTAELGRIEARITKEAARRVVPGATKRLDTRGRRQSVEWSNRWRLWSP